jgi:hypothetical protein
MDISIFLARLLGLYLLIVIPAVYFNRHLMTKMMKELDDNVAAVYLSGFLNLILGLLVVLSHNVWSGDWRVLITVIGWIGIIKGLIRLYFPEKLPALVRAGSSWLTTSCLLFFLIGVFLVYKGFWTG